MSLKYGNLLNNMIADYHNEISRLQQGKPLLGRRKYKSWPTWSIGKIVMKGLLVESIVHENFWTPRSDVILA